MAQTIFDQSFEFVAARNRSADREHCRRLYFEGAHCVLVEITDALNHLPPGGLAEALTKIINDVMDFGERTAMERVRGDVLNASVRGDR